MYGFEVGLKGNWATGDPKHFINLKMKMKNEKFVMTMKFMTTKINNFHAKMHVFIIYFQKMTFEKCAIPWVVKTLQLLILPWLEEFVPP